ncbi:MAG TPA: indole-3-glycerol phosphate synthase TrpC [Desulfotomaculum sp.]|nr:MAG: Indole-3-glycerol phosphate synthase [Desulfotomaculum sp. 46_80]KUK85269.1 MAG: Indole-3-glycerol phosphate synthase [Desulfofundulus kuznetsovii]HAG11452.1 indole-3-glycerol phosphate synthase TrpC [Desulfotomaculum sp.]HBY03228.1 indole-3-glycerol phosphate synthase TrpC [Desulfotomaculum sp.]
MILEQIISQKRHDLKTIKERRPLDSLLSSLKGMPPCRSLKAALRKQGRVSILAEIKKASPSKGMIRPDFNLEEITDDFTLSGVSAISVITEEKFFYGKPDYLQAVRSRTELPVLRKDFIIDPYQIYETRVLGGDALLLIVAVLNKYELVFFQKLASELNLECLVEVHNKEELQMALDSGASLIGINNRDLKTFEIDLNVTFNLRRYITDQSTVVVSESGISSRPQVDELYRNKIDAVLVGEVLMRSENIKAKVKELTGVY